MLTQKMARHMRALRHLKKFKTPLIAGAGLLFIGLVFILLPSDIKLSSAEAESTTALTEAVTPTSNVGHIATPNPLRGIYMSQCVVGTPSFRDKLVQLIDDTSLNAVVIDIKDYTGRIGFTTDNPILKASVSDKCGARDMKEFVKRLHDKGIYTIARITVFQDPYYTHLHPEQAVQSKANPGTPWKDRKGLSFIDVSSRPYWDYVVALSKEAHDVLGFDELNYDYIRYPSDGVMADAAYKNPNKPEAVETFWKYLGDHVKPMGAVMSADLFGMTSTNTDDLNIGQQLERALAHFDYVMPMVYPSHYPKGFHNLGDPNLHPYEVVNFSLAAAVKRTIAPASVVQTLAGKAIMETQVVPATKTTATTTREVASGTYTKDVYTASKIRPWLQDFDYGKDYTPADMTAQIKATTDAGLTSWIFWDPGNKYIELKSALTE